MCGELVFPDLPGRGAVQRRRKKEEQPCCNEAKNQSAGESPRRSGRLCACLHCFAILVPGVREIISAIVSDCGLMK